MSEYFEHVTSAGERWDLIAWRYYRAVHRQSALIQANRYLFVDPIRPIPAILPAGLRLRVPVIEETVDETNLPPWKRGQPLPPAPALASRR